MTPVAFDTDAFLNARVVSTYQFPDGSAHNAEAMWWRRTVPTPGATWSLEYANGAGGGPATVDDFGDLVLVEDRR